MGINDNDSIFLTQEEHDLFLLSQTEIDEEESDQRAFENEIMEVHRQYNLRSKKSNDNPTKKAPDFRKTANTPTKKVYDSPPKKNSEVPTKRTSDFVSKIAQTDVPSTSQPKDTSQKNVVEKSYFSNQNKTQTSFNLESQLEKLKIPIPLIELMNKNAYRSEVIKAMNIEASIDTINIVDDQPELLFGPEVDGKSKIGVVLPFYISLNIHDKTLHNSMLDSSASHNLIPKDIIEKLGLDITRPYKDLYSFDSSKLKCIGLIKYLCYFSTNPSQEYGNGHSCCKHTS
jgi:hypothetical protein